MKIANKIELKSEFFGESTIIIAKRGHGKSYAARVVIEEGSANGHTFIVIDPQNAYLNLENFAYLNANDVKDPKALALLLAQSNKNIVISTRMLTIEEQNNFMNSFIKEFRRNRKKGIQTIVIDEIHKFAPEREKTASKNEIRGMFQEDRSYGQGIIGVTQRPARMDKTILSQADNIMLGCVSSYADKQAVKNYLDDQKDIDKIVKLKRGEFFFIGFSEINIIDKIREAKTEHSGNSPKNLLNENDEYFQLNIKKVVKKTMSDKISTSNEPVAGFIPSQAGVVDLVGLGMKVSLGAAVGGIASGLISARFPISPIPFVSTRTLASTGSTIAMYAGYRAIPSGWTMSKDVVKYATAGSAAFMFGSLTWDVLNTLGVRLPGIMGATLSIATGAAPIMTASASKAGTDTNTRFR